MSGRRKSRNPSCYREFILQASKFRPTTDRPIAGSKTPTSGHVHHHHEKGRISRLGKFDGTAFQSPWEPLSGIKSTMLRMDSSNRVWNLYNIRAGSIANFLNTWFFGTKSQFPGKSKNLGGLHETYNTPLKSPLAAAGRHLNDSRTCPMGVGNSQKDKYSPDWEVTVGSSTILCM